MSEELATKPKASCSRRESPTSSNRKVAAGKCRETRRLPAFTTSGGGVATGSEYPPPSSDGWRPALAQSVVALLGLCLASGCVAPAERWLLRSRDGAADPSPDGDAFGDLAATSWPQLPRGSFVMGSPASDPCREPWSSRETAHRVTLSTAFAISPFETTRQEFASLMGYAAQANAACPNCPVAELSWHEAAGYCNRLSERAGLVPCYRCSGAAAELQCAAESAYEGALFYNCPGYRLPTEAEWEYAYRAATSSDAYWGAVEDCTSSANADAHAWYLNNSAGQSHAVGTMQANPWGLFDLAGNVWEWCNDWHEDELGALATVNPSGATSGTHRVTRGGSFDDRVQQLRAAMRDSQLPAQRRAYVGFRCVRSLF